MAWTKTLTLAITFFSYEIGPSYCTCVFLVTRPFTWCHSLWPHDLWPWSLTFFWKTLTLAITFLPEEIRLSYFTCVFLVMRPFTWYYSFWPRDLDLEVWPTFENLNLSYNFLIRRDKAFILHVYSLWQDLLHGTIVFDLVTLTLKFDLLLKTLTLAITFLLEEMGLSYCTCAFLLTRPFTWYHSFDLLTLTFDLLMN